MKLQNVRVGIAVTGSFCTLSNFTDGIRELVTEAKSVTPIFSESVQRIDTRFATAAENITLIEGITGHAGITTIVEAERVGPAGMFDVLVIAPCTGNTLAKLYHGITDSVVTMAVKSHLRNLKPVVLGISSNDILGANAKNLGAMLNTKNIYFIPFFQDDPVNKEKSVTFKPDLLIETIQKAMEGRQLQPLFAVK